jgi:hypothetical protein
MSDCPLRAACVSRRGLLGGPRTRYFVGQPQLCRCSEATLHNSQRSNCGAKLRFTFPKARQRLPQHAPRATGIFE